MKNEIVTSPTVISRWVDKFPDIKALAICTMALGSYSIPAASETRLSVQLSSGGDDLRGGNRAFISLTSIDGSTTSEQLLSEGLGGNTNASTRIIFPETLTRNQIRSITIRHDGNPRSGHPFDTYDNWDLRSMVVRLTASGIIYNSASDLRVNRAPNLIQRFTGQNQRITIPITATGDEPDFVILAFPRMVAPIRHRVVSRDLTIKNLGAAGEVTQVECGDTPTVLNIRLRRNETINVRVRATGRLPHACSVEGVDEEVTANNVTRG